jgi:flagellar assembly factor FliW
MTGAPMTNPIPTTTRAARLTFVTPPPGLDPLVEFDLTEVEGAVGLYTLRDTADADVRLFLLDPAHFVPEYRPTLSAEQFAAIDAGSDAELDVYVVATIADGAPVVNLLAPIVVQPLTARAAQVILEGDEWPLRAELIAPAA